MKMECKANQRTRVISETEPYSGFLKGFELAQTPSEHREVLLVDVKWQIRFPRTFTRQNIQKRV